MKFSLVACAFFATALGQLSGKDIFYVWTPPTTGACLALTPHTRPIPTSLKQCQATCERINSAKMPCLAIAFDPQKSLCHLCDSHLTTTNGSLVHSGVMVAKKSVDGKAAVVSMTGQESHLLKALTNSCNYFANDQDTAKAGLGAIMKNACIKQFGHTPDATHVNADSYPYKMCLSAQTAQWSGLTPQSGQRVVASDTFTNKLNQKVSHSFALTGKYSQTIALSTTNTVSFSESVGYDVTIPDVLTAKFSVSTSMTSSQQKTNTNQNSASYSSTTAVDLNPGQSVEADLNVETQKYNSRFRVPICLDGYFRCQYGSKVNGHYYWYLPIQNFASTSQRCIVQSGQMGAAISIKSHTSVKNL